ncbi:MAG: hypothetical protein JXK04_07330 [Campylobacterales bacterium]|nr:hypothetical protein [Campylobacterales bacterium]
MLELSRNERKAFQDKLLEESSEYEYNFERYEVSYSIAIAYLPDLLDISDICSRIRKSDRNVPLSEHFHAVIFDFTDVQEGIKAANKLLTYFQVSHFGKSVYAAVVTSNAQQTLPQMVTKLFDLLAYSVDHKLDNHITDESQVMKGM